MNTQTILNERGSRYGSFRTHSQIAMMLKDFFRNLPSWHTLSYSQKEALDMIAHKIGRIVNDGGDPNYADSWVDIAGYATLVVNELNEKASEEGKEEEADEEIEGS